MKIEQLELKEEITYTGNYKIRSIKTISKQVAPDTYEQNKSIVNAYITYLKLENATENAIVAFFETEGIFITSIERID